LQLNGKYVPKIVKDAKVKAGQNTAVERQGIMTAKWLHKTPVLVI
jgi:hypothetical protein